MRRIATLLSLSALAAALACDEAPDTGPAALEVQPTAENLIDLLPGYTIAAIEFRDLDSRWGELRAIPPLAKLQDRFLTEIGLDGEDILEIAMERAGLKQRPMMPIEASAGLAMLMLRDFGVLTVHFAGLPPGTSAMLIKFIPPETLQRFGGAEKFADALDQSLDQLAGVIGDEAAFRELLFGAGGAA